MVPAILMISGCPFCMIVVIAVLLFSYDYIYNTTPPALRDMCEFCYLCDFKRIMLMYVISAIQSVAGNICHKSSFPEHLHN